MGWHPAGVLFSIFGRTLILLRAASRWGEGLASNWYRVIGKASLYRWASQHTHTVMSNIFECQKPDTLTLTFQQCLSRIQRTSMHTIFFVFPVISLFFTCKKSKFYCPGLQMNSHANFTYSFPQLKIILIPTMIWSNRFSFITLIACTGSPITEILLLCCDIDLLHIFLSSWNSINKAYCCF